MKYKDIYTQVWIAPQWRGSLLDFVVQIVANLGVTMTMATLMGLGYGCFQYGWQHRANAKLPRTMLDLWSVVLLCVPLWLLATYDLTDASWSWWAFWIGVLVLYDNTASLARDFVLAPALHGGKFVYSTASRWLVLAGISITHTILAFSLLFLVYREHFEPSIKDPLDAVYYSSITFLTVGYGDYKPCDRGGQILVILQLAFVLTFLLTKLPLAVSMFKTVSDTEP